MAVVDVVVVGLLLVAGVLRWRRSRGSAALALLAASAWLAGGLEPGLALAHRPLLAAAVLTGPSSARLGPVAVAAVAVLSIAPLAPPRTDLLTALAAVGVLVGGLAGRPLLGVERRARAVAVGCTAVALAGPSVLRAWSAPVGSMPPETVLAAYSALVVLAAAASVVREVSPGRRGADAVIELSDRTPGETAEAIRGLLADRRGSPLAPGLERGLALLQDNAELQRGLEVRLGEVRRSRGRLLDAADEERRRLERELAQGAGRHLEELVLVLRGLEHGRGPGTTELARQCSQEVTAAQQDLARLARGLHPRRLAEVGLPAALVELTHGLDLPVRVGAPAARYAEPVEAALWYSCAEALTNVAKHAQAHRAEVVVTDTGAVVRARVRDDGVGGATLDPGGGLSGLVDRLESLGGVLRLGPARGGGTEVLIEIPTDIPTGVSDRVAGP